MDEVKDYPPYLDYPKPHKPTTNADRIRAMSDEELEDFLTDLADDGNLRIKEWLRQTAVGGE